MQEAKARLDMEVERLAKEGQERLAVEVEKHSLEGEKERQKFEEEKKLRRDETDKALERLKEEQAVQTLRVKEEEEKLRRGLECKLAEVEGKLKCMEEAAGQGRDYRLATAQGKLTMLQQEIDSLKTVVEMRTTELHQLRAEKVRLEEKLEMFDHTQVAMKKLSAQVEDLKEQLGARADSEYALQEENRRLQAVVMRENSEKKRLSMENEQLSYRMSRQSRESEGDLLDNSGMSISYCEGTAHSLPLVGSPRFSRGCRPLSAPPGKHNLLDSNSPLPPPDSPRVALPPDSPRVIEVVEKSEAVSWKLEYQEGEPAFPLLSSSPGAPNVRKMSPQSPLALRRVVSAGLMTRSLGPLDGIGGLARSNSYSAGTCDSRTPVTVQRSGSVRRKILPAFEPLSESTESESDESKKNSPVEEKKRAEQGMRKSEHPEKEGEVKSAPSSAKQEEQERREELRTPGPVDIVGAGEEFEEGEISSSSEIEAFLERCGEEAFAPNLHRECRSPVSPISSPDTEPELTLRADVALVAPTS